MRWPEAQHRKMNGWGFNDWPDRMVLLEDSLTVFLEFKRPGKTSTAGQEHIQNMLRALGYPVYEVHSVDEAIEACLDAAAWHRRRRRKKR